ncbi:MAG: hypothetical protein ACYTG6_11235 [Planctomycetota bacterium]
MAEARTQAEAAGISSEQQFADRLSDYVKVLAIYPASNERVRRTLDEAVQALHELFDRDFGGVQAGLTLLFRKRDAVVSSQRLPVREGTNLEWLKDRLDKCAVAGIELFPNVTGEALTAFAFQLLRNATRQDMDLTFDDLWPDEFEGLSLIDRRFEGSFTGLGTDEDTSVDRDSRVVDTSEEQELVRILMARDKIVTVLDRIQGSIDAQVAPGTVMKGMDLLGRILKFMPAETLQDIDKVTVVTTRVLEVLDEEIRDQHLDNQLSALTNDQTLRTLMFAVSRSIFGRADKHSARLVERARRPGEKVERRARPQGHAGDEAVQDDLAALRDELAALPECPPAAELEEGMEISAEQLGIYLHYLTTLTSERRADRVVPHLHRILAEPGAEDLAVLREYLEPIWHDTVETLPGADHGRVAAFLVDSGLQHLVRLSGILTADHLLARFPRDFGMYLDALDLSREEDQAELDRFCSSLAPDRVEAAAEELWTPACLLDEDRRERLLSLGKRSVMPFAKVVLDRSRGALKTEVVQFLRKLRIEAREARPLRLRDRVDGLPTDFVAGLLSPAADGTYPSELQHQAMQEICRYITQTEGTGTDPIRRAYAVRALAGFPAATVRPFLKELLGARRFLFVPREPRAVRVAAREVLTSLRIG